MSAIAMAPAAALLTKREAAQFLHVSVRTLDRLLIPRVRVRNSVRYRPAALEQFAIAHEVASTAEVVHAS